MKRTQPLRGFTLIEVLVTLTVMAVLLAVVVPSFQSAFLSNRLASYANSWMASAQVARAEAIKRNKQVVLCRSEDGDTCTASGSWQKGWIVCVDDGAVDPPVADGTCASGETKLLKQGALAVDYHFTPNCVSGACAGTGYAFSFRPGGVNSDFPQWMLMLCRATPSAGNQERELYLKATGTTFVKPTHAGSCA
jgi:type IV fimbrial biogenesis protein FimT